MIHRFLIPLALAVGLCFAQQTRVPGKFDAGGLTKARSIQAVESILGPCKSEPVHIQLAWDTAFAIFFAGLGFLEVQAIPLGGYLHAAGYVLFAITCLFDLTENILIWSYVRSPSEQAARRLCKIEPPKLALYFIAIPFASAAFIYFLLLGG